MFLTGNLTNADLDLPEILPFAKRDQGKWLVLFPYDVIHESDIRVTSGEVVTRLNSDDNSWLWVRRSDGTEGFVPKIVLCKLPPDLRLDGKIG